MPTSGLSPPNEKDSKAFKGFANPCEHCLNSTLQRQAAVDVRMHNGSRPGVRSLRHVVGHVVHASKFEADNAESGRGVRSD